jgi:hypothetical protein
VIEIEDDVVGELNKCRVSLDEKLWNMETPNPEIVASNSEEIFLRLEDRKFTNFKAATDYLNCNTHLKEIKMTISPSSYELPE